MGELAEGRFFDAYGASMDAALAVKVAEIEPWLVDGLVVDRGCGTGALMKHLARRNRKVVGIDLSEKLSRNHAGVILADVMDAVFADGFVENIVLSSVMHEVYSYRGRSMSAVTACLTNCARELRRGGRIIVRDLWSPEPDAPSRRLRMDTETWDRFMDFRKRFVGPVEAEVNEPHRSAVCSTRTAAEFLNKKDYVRHWDLELQEVYGSVPLSTYREIAATLKLEVVRAEPVRNDWIIDNRWKKGVVGDLPEFTNQVVVLEKP